MGRLEFAGKTYEIRLDNGVVFHHEYAASGTKLHYESVAGAVEGGSEDVSLHTAVIAPGIYLLQWNEISGMSVGMALNLKARTVHAFWTHEAGGELHTELRTGTITEIG